MKTNAEIRSEVTAAIVAALERGTSPWRMPWYSPAGGAAPHNAVSGHRYRGCNAFLLWAVGTHYPTSQWLTFNQARQCGGSVRKGEHATHIVFTKPIQVPTAADGRDGPDGVKKIFLLRTFSVFNVAQCDGLALPARELSPVTSVTLDAGAELHALAAARSIAIEHGHSKACFDVTRDVVCMPDANRFHHAHGYAATLAHELTHATGHDARLSRGMFGKGPDLYAREELVAELGAAMICAELGIASESVESHAAYIASWLEILRADNRAIFEAARMAERACDWLLDRKTETDATAAESARVAA